MKSESIGADISKAEVLNVSPHGFWLMVREREYFLSFADFPGFGPLQFSKFLQSNSLIEATFIGLNWTLI